MGHIRADLRGALRALVRAPGFAATAILSIAIGIGANTAIFSVASALLLRPLPYSDAERLVILWNRSPGIGIAEDWFSTAQYFDIVRTHRGFEGVAIAIGANWNLTSDGRPERIGALRMSSNLLPMLGVRAELGKLFGPEDDRPGRVGKVLLAHGTWTRRYGGDRAVLGRVLTLNGQPYAVTGVLPSGFDLPREVMPTLGGAEHADVILPLPLAADAPLVRNGEDYNLLGKLKPGVSVATAQAEMDALTARLRREHPDVYPANGGLTFSIVPLQQQVVGDARRSILVLSAAVGFVLLIACANVANLLLSRGLARRREMAVRAAIGATRVQLVRQLLTESVVLALAGGSVGVLLAVGALNGIRALGSKSVPRLDEIAINVEVLLFTLIVSIVAGVIFGLVPAFRVTSTTVSSLKDASRGSSEIGAMWGRGQNPRRLLVIAELALSVMLLIGAGLLIRSFWRLQQVSPGFNADRVLTFELTMTGPRYADPDRVPAAYRDLWSRLAGMPGAKGAGGVSMLPLSQMFAWGPIVLEGRALPSGESFVNVDQRVVGGRYFDVMQIPLLKGRLFTEHDIKDAPRVVVIDDHMAQVLWPGEDPIGKRLRRGGMDASEDAPWLTVVGIVGRIKQYTLDEHDSRIAMYHPHTQVPSRAMNVVIRATGDPAGLAAEAARQVREVAPDLPLYNVRTMAQRVDESLARRRFAMVLFSVFAALALGLASIGVYGVMACLVSQGSRDIGIRLALGATPRRMLLMVVRHGAMVAAIGTIPGLGGAIVVTRTLEHLLFDVTPTDTATFTAVAALLIGVTLIGSYVPARRAAKIDPAVSLRDE
jgi:putative ABC transport system permease protein